MKISKLTVDNAVYYEPNQLKKRQFTKGWALSMVGFVVYAVLRLTGHKPKVYNGICEYFEVGKNWGGFEMGWFFVCGKESPDSTKAHEVGHAVQNANVGGLRMLACSIGSAFRYWYRRIFKVKTPYDSWWFENGATTIGRAYVNKYKTE